MSCDHTCKNIDAMKSKPGAPVYACPNASCTNGVCNCGTDCVLARDYDNLCYPFKVSHVSSIYNDNGVLISGPPPFYFENRAQVDDALNSEEYTLVYPSADGAKHQRAITDNDVGPGMTQKSKRGNNQGIEGEGDDNIPTTSPGYPTTSPTDQWETTIPGEYLTTFPAFDPNSKYNGVSVITANMTLVPNNETRDPTIRTLSPEELARPLDSDEDDQYDEEAVEEEVEEDTETIPPVTNKPAPCNYNCKNINLTKSTPSKTVYHCPKARCTNGFCNCGSDCTLASDFDNICYPYKVAHKSTLFNEGVHVSGPKPIYLETKEQVDDILKNEKYGVIFPEKYEGNKFVPENTNEDCVKFNFNKISYCIVGEDTTKITDELYKMRSELFNEYTDCKLDILKHHTDTVKIINDKNTEIKDFLHGKNGGNCSYPFIYDNMEYCVENKDVIASLSKIKGEIIDEYTNYNVYINSKVKSCSDNISEKYDKIVYYADSNSSKKSIIR